MSKSYIEKPACLHDEFDGEKVTFGVYISTDDHSGADYADLYDAISEWANGEETVSIEFRFDLTSCLESMIEMQQLRNQPDSAISAESRPAFAALRAELLAAIDRIDSLRYET